MLEHKNVVITGGAGRLGRRLVGRFSAEGALVASVARFPEEKPARGSPVRYYAADLTDESAVEHCFAAILSDLGRIDVLIHAAGTWSLTPLLTTTLDDWERILRTNLISTFLCFRTAARYMDEGGNMIAFTSAQGVERGVAEQSAYSAAKAGIMRLVESSADELASRGISVHAIAPSTILYEPEAEASGVSADELVELCIRLCSRHGAPLSGRVFRAYGS